MERATAIYVAVCDPEDSQGPFLGGSRLFQHRSFPLWKLCALAIQEAPLNSLRSFLSFSVCLSVCLKLKGLYVERRLLPQTSALFTSLRCYAQTLIATHHDFRLMYLFQHGRVGTLPVPHPDPNLKLRLAIIRIAPCTPSTT